MNVQSDLIALSQVAHEIMSIALLVVVTSLMAKRFPGVGTVREQWYTAVLIFIPLTIILIFPASASILGFVFSISTLWLFADSTAGVHQPSRGRASISLGAAAVVLTPLLILGWLSLPHGVEARFGQPSRVTTAQEKEHVHYPLHLWGG